MANPTLEPSAPPRTTQPPSEPPGGRGWRAWPLHRRDSALGIVLILPAVLAFSLVVGYPLVRGVTLAFYEYPLIGGVVQWVGLDQFRDTLARDGDFYHALRITVIWAVGAVVSQVALGTFMAVLLNQQIKGRNVLRALVIFPYLVPSVAAILVWKWMFHDVYGIVNSTLQSTGIADEPLQWLTSPGKALFSLIVVGTWRMFPFVFIAVLGRLQTIPPQLYEAAKIDGASAWSRFWLVTVPQLRGVLIITIFLRFIWDFNDYDTIALLTQGGPASATETLPILVFRQMFEGRDAGLAAATSDVILVGLSIFLVFYFATARKLEEADR
jgi:multiple sugar transport system permease protein